SIFLGHQFRSMVAPEFLFENRCRFGRLLPSRASSLLEHSRGRRPLRFAVLRRLCSSRAFRSRSSRVSATDDSLSYNICFFMPKSAPETMSIAPEILAKYEPVIGLEVHVQLLTKTKIFCGCSTRFGDPPNANVCPVCLGLPGALPVLNKRAVEMAMRAALALNCTVQERSRFARKNYFYPDLPKGYQISQYELPLATGGWLDIEVSGFTKRIGITRLHLEDDAAKNLHEGFSQSATKSYIDYNRGGTPLAEIVSEPDIRSSE